MKILLISQYSNELTNNTEPSDKILLVHFYNYHKKIYDTLKKLGHIVLVADGNNKEEIIDIIAHVDLIFPIRNDYGYPNGDIFIRLLCQRYNKKIIGSSSFSKFYESDKIAGKLLCDRLKIKTPSYILPYQMPEINFEGPYIMKPRFSGSSINLSDKNIFYNKETLIQHFRSLPNPECYYIEKYIDGATVTIGCIKGENDEIIFSDPYALNSTTHKVITYEDKKNGGCIRSNIKNNSIKNKLQKYCELLYKSIQPCQIVRFDFMLSKDGKLFFLEMNETPNLSITGGFVQLLMNNNFSSYENLINHLVTTAISSNK